MKDAILKLLDDKLVITDEIRRLASEVAYVDNSGEADWFDIDGDSFGVSTNEEQVCMDSEGYPFESNQYDESWELVEVLRAASSIKKL